MLLRPAFHDPIGTPLRYISTVVRPCAHSRLLAGNVTIRIEQIDDSGRQVWLSYVDRRDDVTFVDDWAWREVIEQNYRLHSYWFVARREGQVEGALALALASHPLLGRYLATAPFGNYGGFYFDSDEARDALIQTAESLCREVRARYVNLRLLDRDTPPPERWQLERSYATYWLDLPDTPDALLAEHIRSKTRWQVAQSMKQGFRIEHGGVELLPSFWHVITRAMKELGSPYHSRAYLSRIFASFGERAKLAVVHARDGQPAAASLLLFRDRTAVQLHANTLRRYRGSYIGEFLYFSVLAECCRLGIRRFDMGRSLIGSGNEEFKMKWRPVRQDLAYLYHLADGGDRLPALNQNNPRLQWAIRAWQRLPLTVHQIAGPYLISGIL